MDSIYYICSRVCNFVNCTASIVSTLVVKLTCVFVADLARKTHAAYTYLINNNTLRLVMDTLGVIIAVVAVILAMLVSLTVVAIIVTLLLLPNKRLDGVQGPYIIYSA